MDSDECIETALEQMGLDVGETQFQFQRAEVPVHLLMQEVEAHYLDDWMRLATVPNEGKKTVSVEARRQLCAVASMCLMFDYQMREDLRIYIANALKAAAESREDDARKFLGLKRDKGQRKTDDPMDQRQRERMAAWFMRHLIGVDGLSEPEAKELACECYKLDTRTIETYWAKHKDTVHGGMFSTDENRDIYRRLMRARKRIHGAK